MAADVSFATGTYRLGQTLGVPGDLCVVVIRVGDAAGRLAARGRLLVDERPPACSVRESPVGADVEPGVVMWDPATGFEVRCTRAGHGPLVFAGRTMVRRD
jgi:hypothetical protein